MTKHAKFGFMLVLVSLLSGCGAAGDIYQEQSRQIINYLLSDFPLPADAEIQKLEGDTKAAAVAKMKEAEFAGIPEADRAKIVALRLMTEAMKVQAQNTQVVQHVSDPEMMNQMMGNSQMMQMMQMMQGAGFGGMPMPFGVGMPSQMQSSQLPGSQSQAGGAGMGMLGMPFVAAAMGNGGGAASSASKDGEHKK